MFKKLGVFTMSASLILGVGAGCVPQSDAQEGDGKGKPDHAGSSQEKVENVIYMIPDGFNTDYATSYRWYKGEDAVWDKHLKGLHKTYSDDSRVTDSAAAGTAMATSVKTNNGTVGLDDDGNQVKTILEASEEKGKATGLVATSTITHATPAAFASHVESRDNQPEIAKQMLDNDVDVMLGGGKGFFLPVSEGGEQQDENLLEQAEEAGYTNVESRDDLMETDDIDVEEGEKLLGLFADGPLKPEMERENTEQPSLSEMTERSIDILGKDKDGFFLMVEGSQIDWAGHDNDPTWALKDTAAFEQAVEKAIEFAEEDGNTLVVIAGDHETGGMTVGSNGEYDTKPELVKDVTATGAFMAEELNENRSNVEQVVESHTPFDLSEEDVQNIRESEDPKLAINQFVSDKALVGWTSTGHTGVDIPVYAYGPQSNSFNGLIDNTDLPKIMAEALKVDLEDK
ncbi:alkaline phosphatase [Halobacillus kuroshimensis]|uniref:Alkaline phosphatase n=1 Tax=Halobacillus kuroshimensis TaxID=302481 RepID=A0ABS3DVJ5_9BACI|nr:alkaline phosphatase [Halobacillus kuroshimensis]MBN8235366.1 alkaline phosphatase [Halobacillus kuroshimensis]